MELVRLLWIIFYSLCGLILILGIFCSFRPGQSAFSCSVIMIWIVFFVLFALASVLLFFDLNRNHTPEFLEFLYKTKVFEKS
ncbi:hypothetical protein MACJ_003695 [Theileria orientalis]|uniref:Uncharacterized protein n=1 Tax=Theileria orientalis TaxID=68886 RepID=A0A976XJP4_THEOR|nr:hypothetical protein MACJ_003695 [Theileria orientalis]